VNPLMPSIAQTMMLRQALVNFDRGSLMNIRNVVLSFAVAFCVSLCSGSFARAQTTIAVSPASQNGTVGATVVAQIRINNVANLHGFSIAVEFDNSILQYQTANATNGTFLGSFLNFTYVGTQPSSSPNKVQVDQAILGTSTTSGSGLLFSITFTALNLGTDSIHVVSIDLRDGTNNTIPATSSSGQVTVGGEGTAPPVPTLVSPSSRTTGISTTATLRWHASGGATSYQLQLSTDSTFLTTSVDRSGISDTSTYVSGLLNDTTYYWRVRASNTGGTSAYSAVWSFRTVAAALTTPTHVFPPNRATGISTNPTLRWNAFAGATSYRLQVGRDSAFSAVIVDQSAISDTFYQVGGLLDSTMYYWHVNATYTGGTTAFSPPWSFRTAGPTSVERASSRVPTACELSQNYPNPFNPVTTIEFSLPKPEHVVLTVYDILGAPVGVVVSEYLTAGHYSARWDGTNVASGIYYYRLVAGRFVQTKKMSLVR
jgi:hypothetical protein